jgi:large subunit ribosomal protein L31
LCEDKPRAQGHPDGPEGDNMKPQTHPEMHEVMVHCQCGNEFMTRSVKKELRVEICSACHPFWTGKQKLMDTAGRVEKFNRKLDKTAALKAAPAPAAAVEAPAVDTTPEA